MLSGKALFALGAAVIAGTFVGLMLTSRGPTNAQLDEKDKLEKFGEEQEKRAAGEGCHDAVGHAVTAAGEFLTSRYGEGAPDEIRELAVHRCIADGWSKDIVACLDKVTSDNEMQRCIGRLEDHQRRALEAEMKAFDARPRRDLDAGVDTPDVDDPFAVDLDNPVWDAGASPADWPSACIEYGEAIERLAACDKMPAASRDALKQAFDTMKQSWSTMSPMQEARDAMANACRQAADAITQVGKSTCGW